MRASIKQSLTRYAVAWIYLIAVCVGNLTYALLSPADRAALVRWSSTSVYNLRHDPVGCLIASAFFTTGYLLAWPALVALAMFGANHALGNWRTLVTCASGHVIGSLVSEGIVGYRVIHASLPPADRYLTDIGMSYVVVSAIAAALLFGSWIARAAAARDLLLLIFAGNIFGGLSQLEVSAVGHLTALVTGATVSTLLIWQRGRKARALFDYASVSSVRKPA
jgi:hypothetical protein